MTEILSRLQAFLTYVRSLSGDENGEAQFFCDRLLQAFGHSGYKIKASEDPLQCLLSLNLEAAD